MLEGFEGYEAGEGDLHGVGVALYHVLLGELVGFGDGVEDVGEEVDLITQ